MYSLVKVLHISSFMLWLGPALGSWLVLKFMQREQGETSVATSLVYRVFFFTLTIEHLAFASLLVTGSWLAITAGWLGSPWLWQKLAVVLLLVLPLELVDIYVGNWQAKRLVSLRSQGQPLSDSQQRLLLFYHGPFTKLALLLLPGSVFLILWLAVSKQAVS